MKGQNIAYLSSSGKNAEAIAHIMAAAFPISEVFVFSF